MTAPRGLPVFVRSLSGNELAAGAAVHVHLDDIAGGPPRRRDGKWGHLTGLRLRVRGTIDTHIDMTQAMPGRLLACMVQNVEVRAGQLPLIDGQPDGEDLNISSILLHRETSVPIPADVTDGTNLAVDTGDVWIDIPFGAVRQDLFLREGDDAIPVSAFDRNIDGAHGLKFRFAAAVAAAQNASSFKGFLNVVMKTVTACDVYAMYRVDGDLNNGFFSARYYAESQADFTLEPIGGGQGAQRLVAIFDPPSATTGQRTHTGYDNLSLRFEDEPVYSGRNWVNLVDLWNLADGHTLSLAMGTAWVALSRTAPQALPLFPRRAGQSLGEDPRGRLTMNIGTRTTTEQRIIQFCRREYNVVASSAIAAATGGKDKFAEKKAVKTKSPGLGNIMDQKLIRKTGT